MIRLFALILLLCGSQLLTAPSAGAEFLQTGPHTFQNSNLHLSIVRVPVSEDAPGLLVLHHPKLPFQLFDPAKLEENPESASLFLALDPETGRFEALHVGRHRYAIRGGFALLLGSGEARARVVLSQQKSQPYLTIFTKTGDQPSLIGFLGVEALVRTSGESAPLLQAASTSERGKQLVQDYEILPGHRLMIDNIPVNTTTVGLNLQSDHPCLKEQALIVAPDAQLDREMLLTASAPPSSVPDLDLERLLPLQSEGPHLMRFDHERREILKIEHLRTFWSEGLRRELCLASKKGRLKN